METHPHTHTERKKIKHYLWEFLMLFLAVFCGFLAENIREQQVEKRREKEYAKELYSEFLSDSVIAANKLKIRLEKEKDMDYMYSFFKDSSLTSLPHEFYPAYTTTMYLINSYAFEPKDGILNQLRNSGSLRYFKNITLQKLFGEISVCINNMRSRNDQEYQFFAYPLKPFILKYFDFNWVNLLRKQDANPDGQILDVLNRYRKGRKIIEGKILNLSSFDRSEATNMISFYKQMLVSTRTLQMNDYITVNRKLLQELRQNYNLK